MLELQKLCCKERRGEVQPFSIKWYQEEWAEKELAKEEDPLALINVGLMRFVSPDVTIPIRGKTLPLKVKKDSSYTEVFAEALVKREAHDKAFDTKTTWKLVYPDEQLAITLPDQPEGEFTLRKYKDQI